MYAVYNEGMKPAKSQSLKGLSIASIEETVDEAMSYLPQRFDISTPEGRDKVRKWMVRVCAVVVSKNADSMAQAAESAIQEAAALAINPDYYADRKRSREKRKAMRAIVQNQQKPKTRAEMQFERLRDSTIKM